jgi:hypothetical protein
VFGDVSQQLAATVKIYLDNCSIHRALDNKSQLRVALEAEAILGILAICEEGGLTLVSSETLLLEADRNPDPMSRAFVLGVLEKAAVFVGIDEQIGARALN